MDLKDIRLLKILEVIEKNPAPSQRELAKRLNISLGLINAFIRQSADNGFVKISPMSKNRLQYHITSRGAAEKRRLTQAFLGYAYQFFKEAKAKIRSLLKRLEKENVQRVVFWGAGELAEITYLTLQDMNIEMVAVIDNQRIGERFSGVTVRDSYHIQDVAYDRILVTRNSVRFTSNEFFDENNIPKSKIVRLV